MATFVDSERGGPRGDGSASELCENKWLWAGVWEKRDREVDTEEMEPRLSCTSGTACGRGGSAVAITEAAASTRLGHLWQGAWFAQAHAGNEHVWRCCVTALLGTVAGVYDGSIRPIVFVRGCMTGLPARLRKS